MALPLSDALRQKIEQRLGFYEDLGTKLFYRERVATTSVSHPAPKPVIHEAREAEDFTQATVETYIDTVLIEEEEILPKPKRPAAAVEAQTRPEARGNATRQLATPSAIDVALFAAPIKTSNFFASLKTVPNDSLLRIREDMGDCQRCRLGKTRKHLVFADGNPKAELVFVGEGPGADEDASGVPFVGRAGKLLTQMIEAMGLRREDVYICNVVKCR
ncbi:MAG TPA: uracil-DNA glycosylase, partial [Candidatus Dormibacteraeota bacterium]|nr:uracil-DNA glycosylase [Candidatus Dormibacteraeota bacterium]